MGDLVAGGTLTWNTADCGTSPTFQPSPPPAVPDSSGITTANILFSSEDSCDVGVEWDPSGPGGPGGSPSSSFTTVDAAPEPLFATPLTPLSQILTPFTTPEFSVQVTDGGSPAPGMFVAWVVSAPMMTPQFFGSVCGPDDFVTDSSGVSTLDFGAGNVNIPPNILGTWTISFEVYRPGEGPCDQQNGQASAKGSFSPNFVFFDMTVEDAQVAFQSPPTSIISGSTGNPFTVLVSSSPSGLPVPGVSVNFSASPGATVSPSGATIVTDGSGLATFPVDAGVPDLAGGQIDAQITVPLQSPMMRSDSVVVTVVDLALSIDTPAPATPTFTEEVAAGFSVLTSADSGNGFDPAGNVPVTFTIASGDATFVGGGSSAVVNTDMTTGIAFSPDIEVGRGAGPILVQADASAYGSTSQSYSVQASSYSLAPSGTPLSQDIAAFGSANLAVLLERTGSSTPLPLDNETIEWQISPADGSSVSPLPSVTDTSGVAAVTFFPAGSGNYTISASFDAGFAGSALQEFTVNVTAPDLTLTAVSGDGQVGDPGTTLPDPLVVRALDDGDPPASAFIEWSAPSGVVLSGSSSSPGSVITELADSSGLSAVQVTLPEQPGSFVITATRLVSSPLGKGSFTPSGPSVSFTVTGNAAVTPSMEVLAGDGASGPTNTTAPLAVRLDLDGSPAPGFSIGWQVVSGNAQVSPGESMTDAEGVARSTLTFGPSPGVSIIRAVSSLGADAVFQITTTDGPAIEIVSGNGQSARPGTPLAQDFVVFVRAPDGSPIADEPVSWALLSADGTLAASSTVTDSQGQTSNRLTLGDRVGDYVVEASIESGARVSFSATATDDPGTGDTVLVLENGDGQRGLIGSRLDQDLAVRLLTDGEAVASAQIFWEVLSGSATLDASSTTTNASGVAVVGLVFGQNMGAVRVRARASNAVDPVIFNLTALNPNVSNVEGSGQTGTAGEPLGQDIAVTVSLPAGKALGGLPIEWRILTGGGSLAAAQTQTDSSGRASNQWTLGDQIGEQTAVAVLPDGQEVPFTATAEAPAIVGSLSVVSGTPQSVPTNSPSAPLVVELRDSTGQPLSGFTIEWSFDEQRVALRDASNLTNEAGRADNIATVLIPGAANVTARVANSDIPAVTFQLTGGVAQIPGLNERERDVGTAVDNACPALAALQSRTPEQEDLFQRCSELVGNAGNNPGEVRTALDEIPSDIGPTMSDQGAESVGTQFDNLDLRLHMIRGEKVGGQRNQFNIGLWTPDGTLPLSFLPSAFMSAAAEGEEVGLDFDRWGFFATGQIGRGKFDAGSRTPKFDYDIAGLTFGVDYRFSDRVVAGVALGYSDNDAELADDRGDVAAKGWNISGYATWYSDNAWYVDGTLMVGRLDYDLRRAVRYSITALDGGRTVIDQLASGSTDGDVFGTSFSVGRDWQKGPWSLNGYFRGQFARVKTDGFVESMRANQPGQGLALAIDSRTTESITSVFGGRATYILSRDWGILMPNFSVEWEHEFEDDPSRLTARLAFDPTASPIERFGEEVDTDYFNVGVGVSALFPGGRSAYLHYEELVGASRQSQGLLSLGVRFEF